MATALQHSEWAYNQADKLASANYPYQFGGGHPDPQLPWVKIDPITGATVPAKGPDCSGGASNILWHAGLLEHQVALDTHGFEKWGYAGKGEFITLWVIDTSSIEHCMLYFSLPGKPHHWWAATHTGGTVGWQSYGSWDPSSVGYVARHPKLP